MISISLVYYIIDYILITKGRLFRSNKSNNYKGNNKSNNTNYNKNNKSE